MTIQDNPFFVLGLPPDASRIEIEREAQKLLGMLELGFADARTYRTPVGPQPRTPEAVRAAVAALRDPSRRLVAELWARHAPAGATAATDGPGAATAATDGPGGGAPPGGAAPASQPALRRALGWRP
jgi:hypothetical protein